MTSARDDLPIVALHGAPGSARDWKRVTTLMTGRTVLTPDRPGYGRRRDVRPGGFFHNARWLLDLLDRNELDRVAIAGYSWGGGAALATALIAPHRVAALALIGSVGTCTALTAVDRVLTWPPVGATVGAVMRRWGPALATRAAHGSGSRLGSNQVAILRADLAAMSQGPAWTSWLVEQRALVEESPTIEGLLSQIQAPAVVLAATRDTAVPPTACRDLARRLPNARLRQIPAGHLMPLEAPAAVAQVILEAVALADNSAVPGGPLTDCPSYV